MLGDGPTSTSAWGTTVALVAECEPRNADRVRLCDALLKRIVEHQVRITASQFCTQRITVSVSQARRNYLRI